MADKPMYYGGTPIYYGGSGGAQYGSYGAYGGVGGSAWQSTGGGGSGGGDGGGGGGSIVGTISMGRMLRVISQRWLSVFVFLLVGLVISFAVYRISPTIYEASSQFTMDMRRSSGTHSSGAVAEITPDFGSSYGEIFNTRLSDWRGSKIVSEIIQRYRTTYPASTVSESDLRSAIAGSQLELQRNSRIIRITVRSQDNVLAAQVAKAYAESIEAFTEEENKVRCDRAVTRIHQQVEMQSRIVERKGKERTDFLVANKVDTLKNAAETVKQELDRANGDLLSFETELSRLVEWEKLLAAVQEKPESFGNLASGTPRAAEIASQYRAFQDANSEYQTLLVTFTEEMPDVKIKKSSLDMARARFLDAVSVALASCRTDITLKRSQIEQLRKRQADKRAEYIECQQRIQLTESGLKQLDTDYDVASRLYEDLVMNENQARREAEANNEIVRVVGSTEQLNVPQTPVLPNPTMIFGAGAVLSLALGLVFVLIIDNLEDTVVSLSDIEGRLALKVLAVLPHIRRKKREQVAKFAVEDKYSQFSESVAGLRNLLESPRYEALSHCMLIISTQPGEGKTITSCSIAISYAQAGKRTLLVDFDMRRPRQAIVWGIDLTRERSFSHMLQGATEGKKPDFTLLPNATKVPGLSVIASLPPDGVSPSMILGASVVADFFEWARANYDRIIIDSPPYGVVGDVVSLAVLVDSSIIMCCPDRTHFKPIQYCSRCLTEAGANILGVIVNDVEIANAAAFSPMNHHRYANRYGYGDGYGYGYGYRPKKSVTDAEEAAKEQEVKNEDPHEEFSDEE